MNENQIDSILKQIDELIRRRLFSDALAVCNDALSRASDSDKHRLNGWKANIYWSAGNADKALEHIKHARAENPNWAGHACYSALWQLELGNYRESYKDAQELFELEKNRGSVAFIDLARKIAAYSLILEGKLIEAINWAEAIEDDKPSWLAGRLITKTGLLKEARRKT